MNILIVRLGALGDIVHTVPAAAALRRAFPEARLDWVVDARHAPFADLVQPIDRVIALEKPSAAAWIDLVRQLRPSRYDVALDFQGLMKSAVIARASGARRVVGFSIWHLREKGARPFYSDVDKGNESAHVIQKNLSLLSTVGVTTTEVRFPLLRTDSPALDVVRADVAAAGASGFALINPGAAWPNKRWPAARYGEVASLSSRHSRASQLRRLGAWRSAARAGGHRRVVGRGQARPADDHRGSARAVARGGADGLG